MTKVLTVILLALTLCGTASADKFTLDIEDKMLDMMPALCPGLRATLPLADRSPWSAPICLEAFVRRGMKDFHMTEKHRESRERERIFILDARNALESAPLAGIGQ